MTDLYADIAEDYKKSKLRPWRQHIEGYTLFRLIGDLRGKSVLDLACGEGFYTRQLKQRGAARVAGVDISEQMIALARAEEARKPLGIDYDVQDAAQVALPEPFDLVVAAYLLNYAQSREQLLGMCQAVARNLKPGGRFVAVNDYSELPVEAFGITRKYGFIKSVSGELREGTPITYTLFNDDGSSFHFDNYFLSRATYEWALQTAGLRDIRWHPPQLSLQGEAAFPAGYWSDFLAQPPVYFLECVRAS